MPPTDLELAVNDIFREVAAEPAPAKLAYLVGLVILAAMLGNAFGFEAILLLGLGWCFLMGWAYGGDALR